MEDVRQAFRFRYSPSNRPCVEVLVVSNDDVVGGGDGLVRGQLIYGDRHLTF